MWSPIRWECMNVISILCLCVGHLYICTGAERKECKGTAVLLWWLSAVHHRRIGRRGGRGEAKRWQGGGKQRSEGSLDRFQFLWTYLAQISSNASIVLLDSLIICGNYRFSLLVYVQDLDFLRERRQSGRGWVRVSKLNGKAIDQISEWLLLVIYTKLISIYPAKFPNDILVIYFSHLPPKCVYFSKITALESGSHVNCVCLATVLSY